MSSGKFCQKKSIREKDNKLSEDETKLYTLGVKLKEFKPLYNDIQNLLDFLNSSNNKLCNILYNILLIESQKPIKTSGNRQHRRWSH